MITVAFVASRLAYATLGVRFNSAPLHSNWQYVDPAMFDRDLIGSLLHLHFQPPLFNLALAAAWRSPFSVDATLHAGFLGLGYALLTASFALGRHLGFTRPQALGVALVVACNPTTVLFENHLFYAYPTAVLLVVATLLLTRYVKSLRTVDGVLFFSALAAVVLIRSLYHPVWLLLAGMGVFAVLPAARRGVLLAAVGPCLVVVALLVKNMVVFGEPSFSTWSGMNVSRASTFQISEEERLSLVKSGALSELALRPPFYDYASYVDSGFGTPPPEPTGHPVLDEPLKSNGGANFNYLGYLGIYRQYRKDALASIRLRPGAYLRGQMLAYTVYLNSPTDFFDDANSARLSSLDAVWRTIAYGEPPRAVTASARQGKSALVSRAWTVGVFTAAALLTVTIAGARLLVAVVRRRRGTDPATVAFLFAWGTIVYSAVAANALEVGENERFRYDIEPLLILVTAWLVRRWWRQVTSETNESAESGDQGGEAGRAGSRQGARVT